MPIRRLEKSYTGTTSTIGGDELAASTIPVKPHIQPGTLQPALAGKLLDGTTSHSGNYGTAQSDGHSYYYTDIKGSKSIKDPRIGAHFGSQRHTFRSMQKLEQETAIHGEEIFSLDGRENIRVGNFPDGSNYMTNNQWGNFLSSNRAGTFLEITGYFNNINIIIRSYTASSKTLAITVNGVTAHSALDLKSTVDSPLNISRYVGVGAVRNIDITSSSSLSSDTVLGINTIKFTMPATDVDFHGIELIAQDKFTDATCDYNNDPTITHDANTRIVAGLTVTGTGIPANATVASVTSSTEFELSAATTGGSVTNGTLTFGTNNIQIPSQNVVSYGKKFTVSDNPHYDPFNGFTSGNLAAVQALIDTSTSLGMSNWLSSSTYYRPFNGGRVVKWIASDGTIKTSVTMMPPNAQNINGTASNAHTLGATNDDAINFNTTAIDHSLSEVAKTFFAREFGNGAANTAGLGNWADGSMLQNADDIGYVMDDGLTSIFANDVEVWGTNGLTVAMESTSADSLSNLFIGTGVSLVSYADGSTRYSETIALNLPYGSHVLRQERTGNNHPDIWLDGISITKSGFNSKGAYQEITFHQPKMPPIPTDACIIADYMLMADFVAHASQTSNTAYITRVSKGTRWVSASRDWHYEDTDGEDYVLDQPTPNALGGFYIYINGTCDSDTSAQAKLPCFGTNFISRGYDAENRHRLYVDDSAKSRTDMTGAYQATGTRLAANEVLGVNTFQSHGTAGQNHNFNGCEIVTPIHTSSHYQPFETPYLKELVGGDRNMEQTNLVVTPDGKTWDEVTRKTDYLGNLVLSVRPDDAFTNMDEIRCDVTRGSVGTRHYFNKDFAIAYDKWICLKDGWYEFHARVHTNDAINTSDYFRWEVNGSTIGQSYQQDADRPGPMVASATGFLKRGDYVQLFGASANNNAGAQDFRILRLK